MWNITGDPKNGMVGMTQGALQEIVQPKWIQPRCKESLVGGYLGVSVQVATPFLKIKLLFSFVTVWALPRSTLVRVGIAHVRSSIYVAQPTLDSQFSAISLLTPLHTSIVSSSQMRI
jgi:hypothetical protein